MKATLALLSLLLLSACAEYKSYETTAPAPAPSPAPPAADPIEVLVKEYNEPRLVLGQAAVVQGLTCSLYTVPSSTTQIVGATLTSVGSWGYHGNFAIATANSAPGLSILPPAIRSVYTSWYVVKCSGLLAVTESGWYSFELSSDDGANLSVGGALINNDGIHATSTKSAAKYLSRGMVSFALDYLDAGGSHALVLKSGGVTVPAENLYH